jgi:hypothetical protein
MSYTLHSLGYETVPSDEDGYSTRITIEGSDDDVIWLRAEEIDAELPIDIDEWPFIVQAVEKLLADRAPNKEAFKPAVTKEFLYEIGFAKGAAIEVLSSNPRALMGAFGWSCTEQGYEYWADRYKSGIELSDDDKALLQSWVDAADYYEKNND